MDYEITEKELAAAARAHPPGAGDHGDDRRRDRRRVRRAHGARRQDRRPVGRPAVRPLSGGLRRRVRDRRLHAGRARRRRRRARRRWRRCPAASVASTVHVGPYSEIGKAYTALQKWMTDEGGGRRGWCARSTSTTRAPCPRRNCSPRSTGRRLAARPARRPGALARPPPEHDREDVADHGHDAHERAMTPSRPRRASRPRGRAWPRSRQDVGLQPHDSSSSATRSANSAWKARSRMRMRSSTL